MLVYRPNSHDFVYNIQVLTSNNDEISTKLYQTSKVLVNHSAVDVCGRATSVFTVHPIDNLGMVNFSIIKVLKDVWVEHRRKREGVRLRGVLDKLNDQEKGYFMTSSEHDDVLINGKADLTEELLMSGLQLQTEVRKRVWKRYHLKTSKLYHENETIRDGFYRGQYDLDWSAEPLKYSSKSMSHYRIVYDEMGTPVFDLTTMHEVFQALIDAIQGNVFFCLDPVRVTDNCSSPGTYVSK